MDKRRVLMTHYDMDGVGCDILLSKMFEFEKKHMSGYAKVKTKIANGDLSGYDSCVVSDICLTPEQFQQIADEYGDRFLLIDHHEPTNEALDYNKNSPVIFNTKYCATALVFQSFIKKLKHIPHLVPFVTAVDAYDMWRHETHPDTFKLGYKLNTLFWKYGYWDFHDRFSDDFSFNLKPFEKTWISNHEKERDAALKASDMNNFGKNSLFVMNITSDYVNDYTLQFPEYDVYFMLYQNPDGKMVLSCRTTLEGVSLGSVARDIRHDYKQILTAGGHPKSCGIDIEEGTSIDVILDIAETINNRIENLYHHGGEDVPF